MTALSLITPSQEESVWAALQSQVHWDTNRGSQRKCKRFDRNSGLVGILVKVSQQAAHWQTKRQILSLFADNVSPAELQEMIPRISKWHIDCQHATEAWKGQPLTEIPSFRTRIGREKADHFIEYISRLEFVKDVAFRTDLATGKCQVSVIMLELCQESNQLFPFLALKAHHRYVLVSLLQARNCYVALVCPNIYQVSTC